MFVMTISRLMTWHPSDGQYGYKFELSETKQLATCISHVSQSQHEQRHNMCQDMSRGVTTGAGGGDTLKMLVLSGNLSETSLKEENSI